MRHPSFHCDGVPQLTSRDDLRLIEDVDFVDICTPTSSHLDLTIWALEHGYHVLCEKPVALTTCRGPPHRGCVPRIGARRDALPSVSLQSGVGAAAKVAGRGRDRPMASRRVARLSPHGGSRHERRPDAVARPARGCRRRDSSRSRHASHLRDARRRPGCRRACVRGRDCCVIETTMSRTARTFSSSILSGSASCS